MRFLNLLLVLLVAAPALAAKTPAALQAQAKVQAEPTHLVVAPHPALLTPAGAFKPARPAPSRRTGGGPRPVMVMPSTLATLGAALGGHQPTPLSQWSPFGRRQLDQKAPGRVLRFVPRSVKPVDLAERTRLMRELNEMLRAVPPSSRLANPAERARLTRELNEMLGALR